DCRYHPLQESGRRCCIRRGPSRPCLASSRRREDRAVRASLGPVGHRRFTNMPTKTKIKSLPKRTAVKQQYTWDLGTLFKSDGDWEKAFDKWSQQRDGYAT